MDYNKLNYENGEHLRYLVTTAKETGYNAVEALNKYTSLEIQNQDIINKKNGKHTGIISTKAKELATKQMMDILKMHVK